MRTYLSLVNQKLGFAMSLLAIALPEKNAEWQLNFQNAALQEAALLHLYNAYHFYLRELAENNGIKNTARITSIISLRNELVALQKFPSEVMELENLLVDSDSWLANLLVHHEKIYESPVKPIEKKSFAHNEGLIELIDLTQAEDRESVKLDCELIKYWGSEFKSLILRQRETSTEY